MTASEISQRLNSKIKQIKSVALKTIEIEGKKSIQLNFVQQGRPKWAPKKIQDGRAILTGKTARLQSQINVFTNDVSNTVTIGSNLSYSRIQNEGGDIRITDKMRKFFWAKFKETKNDAWRRMALTKKQSIHIPARPFLKIPVQDYSRIKQNIEVGVKRVIQ